MEDHYCRVEATEGGVAKNADPYRVKLVQADRQRRVKQTEKHENWRVPENLAILSMATRFRIVYSEFRTFGLLRIVV